KSPNREGFGHGFLEPAARRLEVCVLHPAVAQHVPELVTKLIGELRPMQRRDIDDDPCGLGLIIVQPDVWSAGLVLFAPQTVRLPGGNEAKAGKTTFANASHDSAGIIVTCAAPVAAHFNWGIAKVEVLWSGCGCCVRQRSSNGQ